MRLSFLVLILFTSCKFQKSDTENLYIQLIEEYVRQDSIHLIGKINHTLLPYAHYEIELIDGHISPPPSPSITKSFFNEVVFRKHVNENSQRDTFFMTICDSEFLKSQVIESSKRETPLSIADWARKNEGKVAEDEFIFFSFYTPLFNCDSSQVYLQYDYQNGTYGEGNGAIFEKKNKKWRLVKKIINWMT